MLTLAASDLLHLLPSVDVVKAVEQAACAATTPDVQLPTRLHLSLSGNTYLVMPAGAEGLFVSKIVSVTPGNSARGLPAIQGVVILNDATTGAPVALMDAATVTALRTGAVGATGLKYTTGSDVDTIGIVGCGIQGTWQAIFSARVRPVKKVLCFDRSSAALRAFAVLLDKHAPGVQVVICQSVDELVANTNVVIAATTSSAPVLKDEAARLEGKHFISIGSFTPSMQELPDAVYALSGNVVIDADAAVHEVGDIVNPLAKGLIKPAAIHSLGHVISGARKIDITRTTVFKAVGMALYDLYAAKIFFEAAHAQGIGRDVSLLV
jgi:ornithine cyclodeaminase/alanine dehydrogenase-like protein (mu-crystallin family)